MTRIPAIALAVISTAALFAFITQQPGPTRVFAAPQIQSEPQPIRTGQAQPSAGQGQQSNKNVVITGSQTPLTPIEALQLQALGLQMEIKDLQTQVKTLQDQSASQQNSTRALEASLQALQTQFANHSHKVTVTWPGHPCTFLNQYLITRAGDGKQVQLGLWAESPDPCKNAAWSQEQLPVSTPVQGAQADQVLKSAP